MKQLIKPSALKAGDKVATVSLSWGGAGDAGILWRYEQGKKRLEQMGLQVIEMPHTLKGTEYIYHHPEKRAEDLMTAFKDPSIKAIFTCIGGDDSIRMLPYIDYEVIKTHPKIFIGYSDTTITHFMCLKAGVSSFYGPSLLAEFAENVQLFDYTKEWTEKGLFSSDVMGEVKEAAGWTSEFLPWDETQKNQQRMLNVHEGCELLQGEGKVQGRLIGGCMEVLEMLKGTELWPSKEVWEDSLLFFETSEEKPAPIFIEFWLRNYGAQGILQQAKGILFGKPFDNAYYEEYKASILKVIRDELKLTQLPILYNMNFGHTSPMFILPYGAMAEINCEQKRFSILEAGVI